MKTALMTLFPESFLCHRQPVGESGIRCMGADREL